jgi:hypothetical protein
MATCVRVSDDIAGRVASGALTMGDEPPSVREAARLSADSRRGRDRWVAEDDPFLVQR